MRFSLMWKMKCHKENQQYMVEQSDLAAGSVEKKIPPPSKQHLVDWITGAKK